MDKLQKLLKYVENNNDFYANRLKDKNVHCEIDNYPLLSRAELQNGRYDMLSNSYNGKNFDFLMRRTTSGSSGMPINVYWTPDDFSKSMMTLWRLRRQYYGIYPNSRQINFTLNYYQVNRKITELEHTLKDNTLSFSRSSFVGEKDYYKFYKLINEFQPEWFYIQPFILDKIVDYYMENKYKLPESVRYIECVGEILTPEVREKASRYFNITIANMYGSEEMNGIALECPYNNMHLIEDNIFAECITDNGINELGDGEIVITNLVNHAMPIVRYLQGDIVTIEASKECKCGNKHRIIKVIKGRKQESFHINDREITGYVLVEAISAVNNILGDPIKRYKFTYDSNIKKLSVKLVIHTSFEKWKNTISQTLQDILEKEKIEGIEFDIEFVNDIYISGEGKYKILELI